MPTRLWPVASPAASLAKAPITPLKLPWLQGHVNDALASLGELSGLTFPCRDELESPNKRSKSPAHEIKRCFSYLFFNARDVLEREIEDFLDYMPAYSANDEKLEILLSKLTACARTVSGSATKRSITNVSGSSAGNRGNSVDPSTPTASIKHAPPQRMNFSDVPPIPRPKLEPSSSRANTFQPPGSRAGLPLAQAAVSFKSEKIATTTGTTSAATSFWSEPTGTANPALNLGTPDTQLDEPPVSTKTVGDELSQETDYLPASMSDATIHAICEAEKAVAQHVKEQKNSPVHQQKPSALRRTEPILKSTTAASRVRTIIEEGLPRLDLPLSFDVLPFQLRWECRRLLQTQGMSGSELEIAWKHPRTFSSLQAVAWERGLPFEGGAEPDPTDSVTFYAKMRWRKACTGPVFELELSPPRHEPSNSFQRAFGTDRFIFVDVPALGVPPSHSGIGKQNGAEISSNFMQMLTLKQHFLGRDWQQFHIDSKRKSNLKDADFAQHGAFQMTLFATRGQGIQQDFTLGALLDWAVPFRENRDQPTNKAYARIDLSASRSSPTLQLDRSQIRFVPDSRPTDDPDDATFNDPKPHFTNEKTDDPMSDGCSRISRWAMMQIAHTLKLRYVPSVVQARVFGAKGLWYSSEEETNLDDNPPKTVIDIADSQLKVHQPVELADDERTREKLTIAVVNVSTPPSGSYLYPDMLPILHDRGVSKEAIGEIVRRHVDFGHGELLLALEDRNLLRRWIQKENKFREEQNRDSGIQELASGQPRSREARLTKYLDAGFEPLKRTIVAEDICNLVDQRLDMSDKNTRIPLARSTQVFGIADPCGCLEPGEVHIAFTQIFHDEITGGSWSVLQKMTGLVARLPALGSHDMQKVRFVFKSELSHLKDVAIFSAKGPRSLASKLQGGDYDGDKFWLCWEPRLVDPFMNAPVPPTTYSLEELGVTVNKTKLNEDLEIPRSRRLGVSESRVARWVRINTATRLRYDVLGKITLTYGSLIYSENKLDSPRAQLLLCLHSHIIDQDKRGLTYDSNEMDRMMSKQKLKNLPPPAHRQFTGKKGEGRFFASPNKANIQDYVYFEILQAKIEETTAKAQAKLSFPYEQDPELTNLFDQAKLLYKPDSPLIAELNSLGNKLAVLRPQYGKMCAAPREVLPWDEVIKALRQAFDAILPDDMHAATQASWFLANGSAPTHWSLLKASALASVSVEDKMMFWIAGHELSWLKATAPQAKPRVMREDALVEMKPRAAKRKKGDLRSISDDGDEFGNDDGLLEAVEGWG